MVEVELVNPILGKNGYLNTLEKMYGTNYKNYSNYFSRSKQSNI